MGGPFWVRRDRAWSIPKGEYEPDEEPLVAARREFVEELGLPPPTGAHLELGELKQRSGKVIVVWAVEAELDPAAVVPGMFTMEWPRGSGQTQEFPEIDRVEWLGLDEARSRLVGGQVAFLDRLVEQLAAQ
jgi:predicted NUDIX family NTP pyrophosphohydrolase